MFSKTDNPDTVFPFYLRARCSIGSQVNHVCRPEKGVEVFQLTAKGQTVPFAVVNLDRFSDEEVTHIVRDLDGNQVLELECADKWLGMIIAEPDFVSDRVVEVLGVGHDVFYRYTLLVENDMIVLDIGTGIADDGTPQIDMQCRRMMIFMPKDDEETNEEEVDGRKAPIIKVELIPLTM